MKTTPGLVCIYVLDASACLAQFESWQKLLDQSETARFSRISNQTVRANFLAGRTLLRKKLADHLQTEPDQLQFGILDHGKPFIKNHAIEFNLSHSRQTIALAISDHIPLGIDIEYIKRNNQILKIADRYFSRPECEQLARAKDKRELFFNFWTLKEAYIKSLGLGLRKGLKRFGYDLSDKIQIWDADQDVEQTSFFSYRLANDFHLSLCVLESDVPPPRLIAVDPNFNETDLKPLWSVGEPADRQSG